MADEWKKLGGRSHGVVEVLSWNLPGRSEENY
jgi:hypothetical protein